MISQPLPSLCSQSAESGLITMASSFLGSQPLWRVAIFNAVGPADKMLETVDSNEWTEQQSLVSYPWAVAIAEDKI